MGSISIVSPIKCLTKYVTEGNTSEEKYIRISTTHACYKESDNPLTTNKKGYPCDQLSTCNPNQPSNGRYPFPKPLEASSPCPPPRARPCLWRTARVRMNSRLRTGGRTGLADKAKESEDNKIMKG